MTKSDKFLTRQVLPEPEQKFGSFLLSVFYALFRFTAGLLVHPYQTMQLLVEEEVFAWLAFLPAIILSLATAAWKIFLLPLLQILKPLLCQFLGEGCLDFAAFWPSLLSTWFVVFCFYWQILLLYLLFRFVRAFKFKQIDSSETLDES